MVSPRKGNASKSVRFPFSAVHGQSNFKLALLLAAINPAIGGVLVSGPRGSAKSTLAKSLVGVLPAIEQVQPEFVTLPLGASEEMLTGTLSLQGVIDHQKVQFQPGLLKKADGGILYVDEINLLPDNLVDQLLDVAASGVNIVERDGISHTHDSNFLLLGTMNPDEGDLRPQLTDRFGLSVHLSNQYSIESRMEVVRLREAFDANPSQFCEEYAQVQKAITDQLSHAMALLPKVECNIDERKLIAERCQAAHVDGLRGDIVWLQAARAHAALNGRTLVTEQDIDAVEAFVLDHRRQSPPNPPSKPPSINNSYSRPESSKKNQGEWGGMQAPETQKTENVDSFSLLSLNSKSSEKSSNTANFVGHGKGTVAGRAHSSEIGSKPNWFRTLAKNFGRWPLTNIAFQPKKQGRHVLNLAILDTSGSVLNHQQFGRAKGVVLQLAKQAYLKREHLCVLGFGQDKVDLLLPLRRAPKAIEAFLDELTAGGGTPMLDALKQAEALQSQWKKQHADSDLNTVIITDGRIKQLPHQSELKGQVLVVDVEQTSVKRGKSKQLAKLLNAQYKPLLA